MSSVFRRTVVLLALIGGGYSTDTYWSLIELWLKPHYSADTFYILDPDYYTQCRCKIINHDTAGGTYELSVAIKTATYETFSYKGNSYKGVIFSYGETDHPKDGTDEEDKVWYVYKGIS